MRIVNDFVFSLSAFASRFQHSHIRALRKSFDQKVRVRLCVISLHSLCKTRKQQFGFLSERVGMISKERIRNLYPVSWVEPFV